MAKKYCKIEKGQTIQSKFISKTLIINDNKKYNQIMIVFFI